MPNETAPPVKTFAIPVPRPDELEIVGGPTSPIREQSLYAQKKTRELEKGDLDWRLAYVLKIILVPFVLGINIWWAHWVRRWISDSGQVGSKFHLGDSVLVALATTSVANFLALILVVMKNLFPDQTKN